MKNFLFISNWTQGNGMSGGDRIWIEFAKKWKEKMHISVMGSPEAKIISERYGLDGIDFFVSMDKIKTGNNLSNVNLIKNLVARTIKAVLGTRKIKIKFDSELYVYSVSDFWPDFFPAFMMKIFHPKITWIAGFYLFAPTPWKKDTPYVGKNKLKGIFYWLIQLPVYVLVKIFADYVFVTSEPDVKYFVTKKRGRERVIVIQGGVDVTAAAEYHAKNNKISMDSRKYDACFLGRLHHQKGVLELIDIWKIVCDRLPQAKLAIIGDGELENEIINKIKEKKLAENIELLGFVDGEEKFDIFKNSKMMLHPATYDSGGMASAEGMAWGLPAVSFDLEALKTYYPKGMLKSILGDNASFADNIIKLLKEDDLYVSTAKDARDLVFEVWDWEKRAQKIIIQII